MFKTNAPVFRLVEKISKRFSSNILFDLEGALRKVFPEIEVTFIDHNQDPTF